MAVKILSTNDLITVVTKTKHLWDNYYIELRNIGIVTNIGFKKYLFVFIKNNKKHIAEQHLIFKLN